MSIPTPHITAKKGDFAKTVLMPGDPKRSRFIAENYLENAVLVNDVRGVQGYTGYYKGKRVSVMASGMGQPAIGIYSYELFNFYDVSSIIRVGSCGSFDPDLRVRDIILAMGACTNGNYAMQYNLPGTFAPIADFGLLKKAAEECEKAGVNYKVGNIFSSDMFYDDANIRKDMSFNPLSFIELDLVAHRFDYLSSNQSPIFSTTLARNVLETELYGTLSVGMPLSTQNGMIINIGATGGFNHYDYYPTNSYTKYDKRDRTEFLYFTPRVLIEQNTLNYKLYPTEGKQRHFDIRYIYGKEEFIPGTLSMEHQFPDKYNKYKHSVVIDLKVDNYYNIAKWFTLGLNANIAVSNPLRMGDYISTVLVSPGYTPTVHSRTLLLEGYRAPIYAAATLIPIFKFSESLSLRAAVGYFQPYREIIEKGGGQYDFSDPFPMGNFLGDAALVWQSPLGPVSLSCAYYQKSDTKFYPQLNIGFLIFKNRGLRN